MSRGKLLGCVLLVAAAVLTPSSSAGAAGTGTVTGRVTDARTGQPLQGISVYVFQRNADDTGWAPPYTGPTDATGAYSIAGVPEGGSRVLFADFSQRYAQKGWPCGYTCFQAGAATLTVTSGDVTADATMSPAGHFKVRLVTEATGGPTPEVSAGAFMVGPGLTGSASSDSSGWAVIRGLWPGTWRVSGTDDAVTYFDRIWSHPSGSLEVSLSEATTVTLTLPLRHKPSVYRDVVRKSGATRYETAMELAEEQAMPAWSHNSVHSGWCWVTDVVVASGEDRSLVDALSASGLAGVYDAPLLLVRGDSVPAIVASAIGAMPAGVKVHIVGGPPAVSEAVKSQLAAIPTVASVDRCSGPTRYETAAMVARRMKTELGGAFPATALIANGANAANFYDALALSPLAFSQHFPILLVAKDSVSATTSATLADLGLTTRYIGGGPPAVSEGVRAQLGVPPANRLAGSTRFGTAIAIASKAHAMGWLDYAQPGVAANLPDALAAGTMLGSAGSDQYDATGSVLLLTAVGSSTLNGETSAFMTSTPFRAEFETGYFCGGANVIPEAPRLSLMSEMN